MEETETLGKYLKRERELRNISLREISKNIRVKEYLLKAIEEDQYSLLPVPTYVRGFLSSYTKYIGLESNDVLLRYERIVKGKLAVHEIVQIPRKNLRKIKYLGAIGGIIGICFIVFYFLFLRPFASLRESIPENQSMIKESLPSVSSSSTPATSLISEAEKKQKSFSVRLKAIEETWVSIQVNGQPEKEITLKPGEGIFYQALDRIHIVIGNAGGLDLVYNEKPLERFGKSGEVVNLLFTPQGVEAKHHEKPKLP